MQDSLRILSNVSWELKEVGAHTCPFKEHSILLNQDKCVLRKELHGGT
jgi:hypothetical protein